jgi:CRISPR/Cas system Type II protein with McrA/HNH and RuvC-like nuclease domain
MGRSVREISRMKRDIIYNRQDGYCYYCGVKMVRYPTVMNMPDKFTVDHIIPISKGGKKDDENLVGACNQCNNAKGSACGHFWIEREFEFKPIVKTFCINTASPTNILGYKKAHSISVSKFVRNNTYRISTCLN